MTIKYYVTDVHQPIVAVNGLNVAGYSPVLANKPYLLQSRTVNNEGPLPRLICHLKKRHGLYYIVPHTRCRHHQQLPQMVKIVAGAASADYWKIEGDKAIRVHVKSRLHKFTPNMHNTYPGTNKTSDPWLFRLGQNRTTIFKFNSDNTKEIVINDDWAHSSGTTELPERWTGKTIFDYLPEPEQKEKVETNVPVPLTHDGAMQTTTGVWITGLRKDMFGRGIIPLQERHYLSRGMNLMVQIQLNSTTNESLQSETLMERRLPSLTIGEILPRDGLWDSVGLAAPSSSEWLLPT